MSHFKTFIFCPAAARCGTVPEIAHAEMVWDNESVAIYRCADGYYMHSGLNVSTCGADGTWQVGTMQCRGVISASRLRVVWTLSRMCEIPVWCFLLFWANLRSFDINWYDHYGCGYQKVKNLKNQEPSWLHITTVLYINHKQNFLWLTWSYALTEIRFGIRHLEVFDEKCLRWVSDGKKEDYIVRCLYNNFMKTYKNILLQKYQRIQNQVREKKYPAL